MSTQFRPLEIPAGVVAKPTKQMRSTAWSEVNLMRWREGEMEPVGGQGAFNYQFASRCKRIHGWYGLDGIYRIAYLCEVHLYVDTEGVLTGFLAQRCRERMSTTEPATTTPVFILERPSSR